MRSHHNKQVHRSSAEKLKRITGSGVATHLDDDIMHDRISAQTWSHHDHIKPLQPVPDAVHSALHKRLYLDPRLHQPTPLIDFACGSSDHMQLSLLALSPDLVAEDEVQERL